MEATSRNQTQTKWVHGEANIADALTKAGAERVILDFMTNFQWTIIQDELNRTAKRRKF